MSEERVDRDEDPAPVLVELGCTALAAFSLFAAAWRYMDLLGDSFWSVATGRFLLEHHRLPATDPFSFTAGRGWIVHMPLSQVIFAWVEGKFGLLALELFGALVLGAALLVAWLPHARSSAARLVGFPCVLALVFVQKDDLCVRGQLFGDLAFALLLLLLFRLRDGLPVHPVSAVVLGALWINLHSSVFVLPCLALAAGASLTTLPVGVRPRRAPFVGFAALGALGMLLNPYHYRLIADLLHLFLSPATRSIDLFRPPDFASPSTWLGFSVIVVPALWAFVRRSPRAGVPDVLVLGIWIAASAISRRYLPLGGMYALAVLGRLASAAWPGRARRFLPGYLALAAAGTSASIWGISTEKDPFRDVPRVEAYMIESLGLPDRIANAYHWGGYLDYAWNGRRKVFVDGRNQLFEGGAFEAAAQLERLESWRGVLDRYGIQTVLWERGSALDHALAESGEWTLVRRGRIAVVWVRRGAR